MSEKLIKIYKALFREYGYQGWWPVTGVADKTSDDPLKQRGYHQGDYDIPLNRSQTFEICLGAVLTQNTSWKNAESAVSNLREKGLLSPERILRCRKETLSEAIRPARYYNQKGEYVRAFTDFFLNSERSRDPERGDLLGVKGVGKETADAILLYAYFKPVFVVDAYTRRMFGYLGIIDPADLYDTIQKVFHRGVSPYLAVYQEYHALIVEHGKHFYSKKPYGKDDTLLQEI